MYLVIFFFCIVIIAAAATVEFFICFDDKAYNCSPEIWIKDLFETPITSVLSLGMTKAPSDWSF